jgi:hypothetical protein
MLSKQSAELLKGVTGATDEELAKLHSGEEKLFNNIEKILKVQTVAEVVKSERCFAQVKVGDKLVFDPFLNPEKSTGVMCPKALLPVMAQIGAIWEMATEWAVSGKEELPEIVWRHVRCLDPGLEDGGLGGVVYNIRMEKIEE